MGKLPGILSRAFVLMGEWWGILSRIFQTVSFFFLNEHRLIMILVIDFATLVAFGSFRMHHLKYKLQTKCAFLTERDVPD